MSRRKTTTKFIQEAIAVHGDVYDYSLVEYSHSHSKIKIICDDHGIFEQRAADHIRSIGCNKCCNITQTRTLNEFIILSNIAHSGKYDYSQSIYVNKRTNINIICRKHGIFTQRPTDHISGRGCAKCTNNVSKSETKWLDAIGLPNDRNHRQVKINQFIVDGYNPTTNTVYEFHGDYWHGNPNTTDHTKLNPSNKQPFKHLYENTLKKETLIKDSGYNLVVMWEHDWKNKTPPLDADGASFNHNI